MAKGKSPGKSSPARRSVASSRSKSKGKASANKKSTAPPKKLSARKPKQKQKSPVPTKESPPSENECTGMNIFVSFKCFLKSIILLGTTMLLSNGSRV